MLVLFDIDGTILSTSGEGRDAMVGAGKAVFGEGFEQKGVSFSGRLDPLIIRDLLIANGIEVTDERVMAVREAYGARLNEVLTRPGVAQAFVGVMDLIEAFDAHPDVTLGVLTGNYPETGEAKLRSVGLDPARFVVPVWGDTSPHDPPHRDHLPAVGVTLYKALHDRHIDPAEVLVIGDTPHDVRCAKVNGCGVLAVATGRFSVEELSFETPEHDSADRVVADLSATAALLEWSLGLMAAGASG